MSIGWPAAIVLVAIIMGVATLVMTQMATRGSIQVEDAKGKYGEQYRMLAADYETLAKETKDAEASIKADVTVLREKIESIEHMMREVG